MDIYENLNRIRKKRESRNDGWVTIRGTHVLIGENGEIEKGPAWAKEAVAKKTGAKKTASKKSTEEKAPGPNYRKRILGGETVWEKVVDNKSGKNKTAAKKLKSLDETIDPKKGKKSINELIRKVIKEESAVRMWPKDGDEYSHDFERLESAVDKVGYINRMLDGEIENCNYNLADLKRDAGPGDYAIEIRKETDKLNYYKGLKKALE